MRELCVKTVLLIVAIAVSCAIAEMFARLVLSPPQVVIVETSSNLRERLDREGRQHALFSLPQHPEEGGLYVETDTGRRLRSNSTAVIENHSLSKRRIEIRTNSLGYRNPEIGEKRGLRVLFLGDSVAFGDFLPEEETFVRLVESKARAEGESWEVINAAVGAVSLENELAILKETGIGLEPDVVVLGFYLNDFLESPGVYIPRIPAVLQQSYLAYHAIMTVWRHLQVKEDASFGRSQAVHLQLEDWREEFMAGRRLKPGDFRVDKAAFDVLIAGRFEDWGGSWSPHAWEHMRPLFQHLRNLSDEYGFELFIVAFPVRYQVEASYLYDYPQQRLREIADQLEIPLLDMLPVLRLEHERGHRELFFDQCHHTTFGNAFIADQILAFLKGQLEHGAAPGPDATSTAGVESQN
jgi:hypothetical protein